MFADLQPQMVARSKTNTPDALARSAAVLAQVARLVDAPWLVEWVNGELRAHPDTGWNDAKAPHPSHAQEGPRVLLVGAIAHESGQPAEDQRRLVGSFPGHLANPNAGVRTSAVDHPRPTPCF